MKLNFDKRKVFIAGQVAVAAMMLLLVIGIVFSIKKNGPASVGRSSETLSESGSMSDMVQENSDTETQTETETGKESQKHSEMESMTGEESQQVASDSESQNILPPETESETETETYIPFGMKGTGSELGIAEETFVFLGIDTRQETFGPGSNADIVMLINVDHSNGEVRLCSVYRDTRLYSPEYGYININNTYNNGGPEATLAALNASLDLEISHYVVSTFGAYSHFVDLIGGIDIELTQAEVDYYGYEDITEAGTYHLSGARALTYARTRKIDNDYKRAERQRKSIYEILTTAQELPIETKLEVARTMLAELETNYSESEVLDLMYALNSYRIVKSTGTPYSLNLGIWEGQWSNIPTDLMDMNRAIHEFLYDNLSYYASETVRQCTEEIKTRYTATENIYAVFEK